MEIVTIIQKIRKAILQDITGQCLVFNYSLINICNIRLKYYLSLTLCCLNLPIMDKKLDEVFYVDISNIFDTR